MMITYNKTNSLPDISEIKTDNDSDDTTPTKPVKKITRRRSDTPNSSNLGVSDLKNIFNNR